MRRTGGVLAITLVVSLGLAAASRAQPGPAPIDPCALAKELGIDVPGCEPKSEPTKGCSEVTLSGDSYLVRVNVPGKINNTTNLVTLPHLGGAEQSFLVDVNQALPAGLGNVTAKVVRNETAGSITPDGLCGAAGSLSSLANLNLTLSAGIIITADLLEATTSAGGCCVNNTCAGASTKIVNLLVDLSGVGGPVIFVPDPVGPNTPISLGPLGTLLLREENVTCSGPPDFNDSEATANVIHLTLVTGIEVIVSHAHSDIWCCCPKQEQGCCVVHGQCFQSPPEQCFGQFVSGGICGVTPECTPQLECCQISDGSCLPACDAECFGAGGFCVPNTVCGPLGCQDASG